MNLQVFRFKLAGCAIILALSALQLFLYHLPPGILIDWDGNICTWVSNSGEDEPSINPPTEVLLQNVTEVDVAEGSIFFHETSCSEDLNPRQACALESAARTNPESQVYILLTSPKANVGPRGGRYLKIVTSAYSNVHALHLHLGTYSRDTPMETWVREGVLLKSKWPVSHTSDALRYLTLWKYGGTYLDLDVVLMHSLKDKKNFAGAEGDGVVAAGVINFEGHRRREGKDCRGKSSGHFLADACLEEFLADYRGDDWGHNGPGVITRVLQKECEHREEGRGSAGEWSDCPCGFVVYPPSTFYPIEWEAWMKYFNESSSSETMKLLDKSIAVHVWNKKSSDAKVRVGSRQPYGLVAAKYCPNVYGNCGAFF